MAILYIVLYFAIWYYETAISRHKEVLTMDETTTSNAITGDLSMSKLESFFEKILSALKKFFAWLGILILPNEQEKEDYSAYTNA